MSNEQNVATVEADNTALVITSDQARIAQLETANRFLTRRNGLLAEKTLQASRWFGELAGRAYLGSAPPIASLEECSAYFYDTGKFVPDLQPFGQAP